MRASHEHQPMHKSVLDNAQTVVSTPGVNFLFYKSKANKGLKGEVQPAITFVLLITSGG